MFDAKNLLEMLVRGQGQPAPSAAPAASNDPMGQIGDLLRQFTQQGGGQTTAAAPATAAGGAATPGLDDLLRNFFPGAGQPQAPAAAPAPQPQSGAPSGGLGDIFGKIQEQMSGGATSGSSGGSNPLDVLGQIFGQATQGVQEGAGKVGQATGLRDIIEKMSGGRSPEELLEQVKKYMSENQLGTGAALGGLGALILGTQTGRSVALGAAKIGALALIGGLAYKAYQNYSEGRPLISGATTTPEPAPAGSGFEDASATHDEAVTLIRGMIAAAASDGRLDDLEQQKIVGNLASEGLDAGAEEFLAKELNSPASIDELVAAVSSPQEGIKLYTAARIAIDPDTQQEQGFLYELGSRLGIDEELMAHIDAQARAAA